MKTSTRIRSPFGVGGDTPHTWTAVKEEMKGNQRGGEKGSQPKLNRSC
jgi:hypothetical protein